jgi:AMIN domain-containing protein
LPRSALQTAVILLVATLSPAGRALAQSGFPEIDEAEVPPALVRSVEVAATPEGPALEIIATRPLVPQITKLASPPRLVIDLPKAYLSSRQKVTFRDAEVNRIRVDQFRKKPPTVRLVVELSKACDAGWDEAGNRLTVRIRAEHPSPAPAPSPVAAQGLAPAAIPGEPPSSGALVMAGDRLAPGSSITAGADTAVVNLERGGQVRVCPGTTVSVASSPDRHSLMLALSTGALETHYRLDASADSILTPDFRILLAGPGEFDYAISADSRGNTCVRALLGNTASAVVSELMGDGIYQVKPFEQVVFHSGHLAVLDASVPADCGCPAPSTTVLRASAESPPANSVQLTPPAASPTHLENQAPERAQAAAGTPNLVGAPSPSAGATIAPSAPETASLPELKPTDIHVQVDAPFVFRASDPPATPPIEAKRASLGDAGPKPPEVAPLPPSPKAPGPQAADHPPHRGFLGKVRNALSSLFK